MEHSEHHQQQQLQSKPLKHSTISLSSAATSPISSMMLQIDPRFIPKNFFKFHKNGTDDEKMAMLERFKNEGIDPKKLNDTKKLPYLWRWLVDAEINCQSLRHQLEKIKIQHEQELQEVEDYVTQVWKLSMERLETLQEENQFLHSKILRLKQRRFSKNDNIEDINDNDNDNDENDYDDDEDDENTSDFLAKYLCGAKSAKLVNERISRKIPKKENDDKQMANSHSTLSFFDCHNLNVINLNKTKNNKNFQNFLRRSSSCDDINKHSNTIITKEHIEQNNDCKDCQKTNIKLLNYENHIDELQKQLLELEEDNSALKKLNRCIEIENENFAYKLAETESQSNQLEQRILMLEQELKINNQKNYYRQLSSESIQINLVVREQKRLINELNEKIKKLEESLDSKRLELEEMEIKLFKLQQRQQLKESNSNFSSSSSWLFRNSNKNDSNNNPHITQTQKDNVVHKHTSDYYGSSDGFEEIKL